jgi:urea transport system ATP-binding protein
MPPEAHVATTIPEIDESHSQPVTGKGSQAPRSGRRSERPSLRVPQERGAVVRAKSHRALLCVDDISVSFDGFKALTNLTLILDVGELRCIIGPNGAGKTTLMDVVTGKTKPDSGHVFFLEDMEDLTTQNEHQIARRGIGRKFQRPTVFPKHTVRENLELALAANKGVLRSLFHRFDKEQNERIDHVMETIGLVDRSGVLAGGLAHGQKQWLEIGMLLAQNPRVLLVDEPIAGMTHQEIEKTAELLRSLAGEHTVVVIEHDMDFVRSIAEKTVTVLHEGKVLAEGSMDEVQSDPKVVEVYLGS